MKALVTIVTGFPRYLWSGWGAVAGVFLFIALWEVGHQYYGDLVLPAPGQTFGVLWQLLHQEELRHDIGLTVNRALWGFGISALIGSVLGMTAGQFVTPSLLSRPLVTILMGMPPIAWIVLAMIWFGMGDRTVIFTVVVASFPIVFVGALQGMRTLDNDLKETARSFNAPLLMRLSDVYFPHVFAFIFPAWIAALGMSWKIVVMAELLAANDGIGAALAIARTQLDTPTAMALIVIMVALLLIVEYLLMEPVKREVERWRQ